MKKKFCKHIVLTTLFSILFSAKCVFAMPAYSEPTQYVQPDGSIIELYSYGDEHYNFVGDAEGYMLEKNEDGKYEYVTYDSPVMMMAALDDNDSRPANAVKGFDLREDEPKTSHAVEFPFKPSVSTFSANADSTQIFNLLTIAVEFNDVKFPEIGFDGQGIYDMIYSTEEGVISVANYYDEVSSGILKVVPAFEITESDGDYGKVADGVIKVLVNKQHPDPEKYSGDEKDAAIESIIKYAMEIVDKYIDFKQFDTESTVDINGKPFIWDIELAFGFIIAGYERSAKSTQTEDSVWAHRYYVPGGIECDGVMLLNNNIYYQEDDVDYSLPGSYAMVGTMYDSTRQMGIGALCHEIGHIIGFPDLYNTENDTNYDSIYTLSLMAQGSWGKKDLSSVPSSMPSHLDAWCKTQAGWYKENEYASIGADTLKVIPIINPMSSESGIRYLKINTNDEDEYFLLENRRFTGFDSSLQYRINNSAPGVDSQGIAVWHIDNDVIAKNIGKNKINTTSNPGVSLVRCGDSAQEAATVDSPLWYCGINKMPFLGKLSSPNSSLNTYTDSSDSGVEIEF